MILKRSLKHMGTYAKLSIAVIGALTLSNSAFSSDTHQKKPNIIVIMADDLGYSDLGIFGSEIQTPNIDSLAKKGRLLTNFHTAAVCSPTRASLLSGADHHLVGLGSMGEVVGMNTVINKPFTAPWGKSNTYDFDNIPEGYVGHLNEKSLSMAELLRDGGYHTYMVGKWHLGYELIAPSKESPRFYKIKKDALPYAKGFEQSFTLMNGGGSHFAPSTPPTPLDIVMYAENDKIFPAKMLPKDFFSTEFYTNKLIDYIGQSIKDEKPFFAYAAYTAPHWPLQAPEEYIKAQKGRYDVGYDAIRDARVKRMKTLGLIPKVMKPAEMVSSVAEGGAGRKKWHELSPEEKAAEAKRMEIYAAMVVNLDDHIGRLIGYLKDKGQYENTMIIFMSDNGAEGAEAYLPKIPGTKVDNSFDNMGKKGSTVAYGERWAEVSAAPFRLFKGFTGAEGGTSAPLVVKLPGQTDKKPTSHARLQVVDILPTLLELAKIDQPGSLYKGRQVAPLEGISLLNVLKSPDAFTAVRDSDAVIADELMGASYVVKGKMKLSQQSTINRKIVFTKSVPWTLYDLETDRGETVDLAKSNPEKVAELKKAYSDYRKRVNLLDNASSYSGR